MDACAWFLLREKKGYCTYFATAMTLLCRISGIPARYVTGYVACPQNGQATVTGADAHAWTEIYLNGFGWLTVDATPSGNEGDSEDSRPSAENSQQPDTAPSSPRDSTPVPSSGPDRHAAPPDTAATPTPLPGTDRPEASAPAPDDSKQTPSPEPEKDTVSGPSVPPLPDDRMNSAGTGENSPRNSIIFLILLVIALLIPAVLRICLTEPHRLACRHPERAYDVWKRSLISALAVLGFRRMPGETLTAFALRAQKAYDSRNAGILQAFSQINACVYGNKAPDPGLIRICCEKLYAGMNVRCRIRLALGRLRRKKTKGR